MNLGAEATIYFRMESMMKKSVLFFIPKYPRPWFINLYLFSNTLYSSNDLHT